MSIYSQSGGNAPQNQNLNALGSSYAAITGASTTAAIARATEKMIYETHPHQYFDLRLLSMIKATAAPSDEIFWAEQGYQRSPVTVTGAVSGVSYPNIMTVPVQDVDAVGIDYIVVADDGSHGIVKDKNEGASTIDIQPQFDGSFPTLAANDELSVHSPIEADGAEDFLNYERTSHIERSNNVQLFSRAMKYGEVELIKWKNMGNYTNKLSLEKENMFKQQRLDISNAFWNGKKGEFTLKSGVKAKSMGGVHNFMVEAGSPVINASISTLDVAIESLASQTAYGEYGEQKFFFAPNDMITQISKAYKGDKTRYAPDYDDVVKLNLQKIHTGAVEIVLVPYNRFTDRSCFPSSWANKGILLDPNSIKVKKLIMPRTGDNSKDARANGGRNRSIETWCDDSLSIEIINPLSFGEIQLS
jgi:hypothetical protein